MTLDEIAARGRKSARSRGRRNGRGRGANRSRASRQRNVNSRGRRTIGMRGQRRTTSLGKDVRKRIRISGLVPKVSNENLKVNYFN